MILKLLLSSQLRIYTENRDIGLRDCLILKLNEEEMNLIDIQQRLRKFAEDRNWDQFHSPKNLSMALAAEAAELLEIFQWVTEEQSKDIVSSEKEIAHVKEEIADVFIYLVRLADKLNIDIEKEVFAKIALNEKKYPIELSKDNAVKYNRR